MPALPQHPIPAVSGVVIHEGRALFVRRCNPPNAGKLALPGGKINLGETPIAATQRELLEETGLTVEPTKLLHVTTAFEHNANGELTREYVIISYLCELISGTASAQDDACEIQWLDKAEMRACQEACAGVVEVALLAL